MESPRGITPFSKGFEHVSFFQTLGSVVRRGVSDVPLPSQISLNYITPSEANHRAVSRAESQQLAVHDQWSVGNC